MYNSTCINMKYALVPCLQLVHKLSEHLNKISNTVYPFSGKPSCIFVIQVMLKPIHYHPLITDSCLIMKVEIPVGGLFDASFQTIERQFTYLKCYCSILLQS